jgi:hypothetical protein
MDSFPVWLYVFGRLLQRLDLLPAHIPQIFARSLLQIFHARCLPACPPAGNPHTHSPTLFAAALQVLLIIAATHLDAVAFQIFSQSFKLVPTALFAYWLLGQTLAPMQVIPQHGKAWARMQGRGRRSGAAAAFCPPGLLTSDHLLAPACAPCCSGPQYRCWLRVWS